MITTLLLDLGGVIMDIDKSNCARAFTRLGMVDVSRYLGEYSQKGIFRKIEEGSIGPEEFRAEIRRLIPSPVTDGQIDDAFNDFLLGIPLERLRALERLRRDYRIFMLSNTNPIMWNSFIDKAFRIDGHDRDYYFDGCLTSFEAKAMKPDPAIFRQAVERFGLVPTETIFIDDSEDNCLAARKLGFEARHVTPTRQFPEILSI